MGLSKAMSRLSLSSPDEFLVDRDAAMQSFKNICKFIVRSTF